LRQGFKASKGFKQVKASSKGSMRAGVWGKGLRPRFEATQRSNSNNFKKQLKRRTQRTSRSNSKKQLKQLQEETQTTSRGNSNLSLSLSLLTFSASWASSPSAIANDLMHKLVGWVDNVEPRKWRV
jgi:hypothetical protein